MNSFGAAHEQAASQPLHLGDSVYVWPAGMYSQAATPELPVYAEPVQATYPCPVQPQVEQGSVYISQYAQASLAKPATIRATAAVVYPHAPQTAANIQPAARSQAAEIREGIQKGMKIAVAIGTAVAALALPSDRHEVKIAGKLPTSQEVAEVNQLLKRTDVSQIPRGMSPKTFTEKQATVAGAEEVAFKRRQQIAEKHRVTVYDPTETLRSLTENDLSPDQALHIVNEYFKKYDTPVVHENADQAYTYHDNQRPASPYTLASDNARHILINLVRDRARLPKEYTDNLGVTRILLSEQTPGTPFISAAYATPHTDPHQGNAIVVNMSNQPQDDVLQHEYAHKLDEQLSGDWDAMANEPDFHQAINNAPYGNTTVAGKTDISARANGYYTYDDYTKVRDAQADIVANHAGDPHCRTIAKQASDTIRQVGRKTAFYSVYGGFKPQENYAVIAQVATDGERQREAFSDIMAGNLPLLRGQVAIELARLNYDGPKGDALKGYFIDAAYKHQPVTHISLTDYCN